MYAKLAIKGYLVLFGINLVLGGYLWDNTGLVYLSLLNVVALFVILFQHSDLFAKLPTNGRVLFSADVFAFLAIWFGLFATYFVYPHYETLLTSEILGIVLLGGFFFIGSAWLFRMFEGKQWNHRAINTLAGVLIISFVMIEGGWLYSTHGAVLEDYIAGVETWSRTTIDTIGSPSSSDEPVASPEDVEEMLDELDIALEDADVEEETESETLFDIDRPTDEVLTYGNFLPVLKDTYGLPTLDGSTIFTYVSQSNDLYPAFQAAYAKRMIGSRTNPATQIRCGNLMVLLGLAEGWEVVYAPSNIISQFWGEATDRGYTDAGCASTDQLATRSDLP